MALSRFFYRYDGLGDGVLFSGLKVAIAIGP